MRKDYQYYAQAGGYNRRRLPQINFVTFSVLGNKHAWLLLLSFIAGQAIQLVLQATSRGLSVYYQERFCLAAGFIIAFVFFAGMLVDARTRPAPSIRETKKEEETKKEKEEQPDENKAD